MTEMTICYGMTETSPVSTQTLIGDPLEKQVATVGCVHPHLEIKIVDEDGRIKDMVIRGGENIYPLEIEEFLYKHEAVQEVHVFGVHDAHFGEEICAWIKVKDGQAVTEEDIRAFCQGRITHYKIPRDVQFVDSFPMTVTGKAQKFKMRETVESRLASSDGRSVQ